MKNENSVRQPQIGEIKTNKTEKKKRKRIRRRRIRRR